MLFSQMRWLPLAIGTMMLTGLFIKMSNGATYAVVPFVNRKRPWRGSGNRGRGGQRRVGTGWVLLQGRHALDSGFALAGSDHHGDFPIFDCGPLL